MHCPNNYDCTNCVDKCEDEMVAKKEKIDSTYFYTVDENSNTLSAEQIADIVKELRQDLVNRVTTSQPMPNLSAPELPNRSWPFDKKAIQVKVMLLDGGKMPKKQTAGAACYDLYAAEESYIGANGQCNVKLGIALEIPNGHEGQIRPRSGMTSREVWIASGTIDNDYRGELKATVRNMSKKSIMIKKGDRIAQLAIRPVPEVEFIPVDSLSETERGAGGFGHTGR